MPVKELQPGCGGRRQAVHDEQGGGGPVQKLPLSGGEPSDFAGHNCGKVLGTDARGVIAWCTGGVQRLLYSGGTPEPLLAKMDDHDHLLSATHIYFTMSKSRVDGPFEIARVPLNGGAVESLATIDGIRRLMIQAVALGGDALYLSLDKSSFDPFPGIQLRIDAR